MIEQLESRTFFSVTPLAALTVLRSDVAGIGQKINTMIVANEAAIANLQNDMSIFPTANTTDNQSLRLLNVEFRLQVSTLANDYNDIKVFFGQDITRLINDSNAYNRHPTAKVGLVVQESQQLLAAQGNAAINTLTQDSDQLQAGYVQELAQIAANHPLDATLVARTGHIVTALADNVAAIQSAASTVAATDIPNFITALEPNGVISTTTA